MSLSGCLYNWIYILTMTLPWKSHRIDGLGVTPILNCIYQWGSPPPSTSTLSKAKVSHSILQLLIISSLFIHNAPSSQHNMSCASSDCKKQRWQRCMANLKIKEAEQNCDFYKTSYEKKCGEILELQRLLEAKEEYIKKWEAYNAAAQVNQNRVHDGRS